MHHALRVLALACAISPAGELRALTVALDRSEASALAAQGMPDRFDRAIGGNPDQALFDQAVLVYSNAARRVHALPPLGTDGKLARAAAGHAENMARLRTHSHTLPVRGQSQFKQRIDRQGLRYRKAGENIAMNKVYRLLGRPISTRMTGCSFTYGDTGEDVPIHTYASLAREAVARWLASPKHRASLLSPEFRRMGSGIGVDPAGPACGDLYLVQDFAD